jgi:hypothetical protein
MIEIVINKCYGGFGLSELAIRTLRQRNVEWANEVVLFGETYENGAVKDSNFDSYNPYKLSRDDKDLVQVVKDLGEKAYGEYSKLSIVDIPDDVEWEIDDYDGFESIDEIHRTWG